MVTARSRGSARRTLPRSFDQAAAGQSQEDVLEAGAAHHGTLDRNVAFVDLAESVLAIIGVQQDAVGKLLDTVRQSSQLALGFEPSQFIEPPVQVIERGRLLRWPGLPIALDTLAAVEFRTGRWPSADAHSAEALRLARDRGRAFEIASASTTLARVAAARGAEADCRSLLDDARSLAGAGTLAAAYTASAGGFLELSLGRPEAARKGNVLRGRQRLSAKHQHLALEESALEIVECRSRQWLGSIDVRDFEPETGRKRLRLQHDSS